MVAKIATGEIEEELEEKQAGKVNGGNARAASMTPEERKELAQTAARAVGMIEFVSDAVSNVLRTVVSLQRTSHIA